MATVGAFVDFGDFGAFVIFGDLELLKDRDWCAFRGRRETKRIGENPERAHAGRKVQQCVSIQHHQDKAQFVSLVERVAHCLHIPSSDARGMSPVRARVVREDALAGGIDGSRGQDRNEGDEEGGSEEAIHLERYAVVGRIEKVALRLSVRW